MSFSASCTKRTDCTFSLTAGIVLIYLWTNFTDIDEKRDSGWPKKTVSCKLTQLCNFCRQSSGPFCHLSPQQPFQEGGNYQSTPLLFSTTHQTHERNEENPTSKNFCEARKEIEFLEIYFLK